MCDYSLEQQLSRPAVAGDRLLTTQFYQSTTRGFCAAEDRHVAVCLRPGTEIAFAGPVMEDGPLGFFYRVRNPQVRTARFRHINEDNPQTHHDALEFADGHIVLLTKLRPGQQAVVIQLPAVPRTQPATAPGELETV